MSNHSSLSINLKEKVLEVLKLNNHTFTELGEHIGIPEKALDRQFTDNSLAVGTLELISKALRIPLYSLFRDTKYEYKFDKKLYYNVNIWGKDGVELRTTLKKDTNGNISDAEIGKLRKEIKEKEKLLHEMETKLNKK